jgi:hydroxymethylglutaryl-CoA synthase
MKGQLVMSANRLFHLRKAGIEVIAPYVPSNYFPLKELARVRNVNPEKYTIGLGCEKMSVLCPTDDPVTMGANAALLAIDTGEINPDEIGYLVVGTETAVDESKPIAVYIHEMLGLGEKCRCVDMKNACYAGTAALRSAMSWVMTPACKGRKALVITTDVAYYDLHSAGEPTQGAAATAVVVSSSPDIVAIDIENEAVYTKEVMDFWRPIYRNSPIVNGHFSMECYLKSLEKTWFDYKKQTGLSFEDYDYLVFHTPFSKMAKKAHSHLFNIEGGEKVIGSTEAESFKQKVFPATIASREMGNVYSSSLFLAFISLIENRKINPNERVGFFSYGSGSSAEFVSGIIGKNIGKFYKNTGLSDQLSNRKEISYDDYLLNRAAYERRLRDGFFVSDKPTESNPFVYLGIKNHKRQYDWIKSPIIKLSGKIKPRMSDSLIR